jgi:aminomethyltransferase
LNVASALGYNEARMARETAFHPITSQTAAGYGDEAGWLWVTNFGDVDTEYRAIRQGVGMWDLSPLNKWSFRGPQAKEAAQRVHTHDVMGAEPGQVHYGAFVDEDGLLVDDGTVFTFADDELWVCTNSDDRAEYFADATKGLDVSIEYIAPDLPSMQVQGPKSRELLQALTDVDLRSVAYFRFVPEQVEVGGVPVWLSRTGFSGELGYELFLRPDHALDLWGVITAAGATPYGMDVIEPIRVEAGMIVTDYDYEPHERSPFDLGLDRFVKFHELHMGTDALRVAAEERPNRFVTLRLDGDLPDPGTPVRVGGREVGTLTSPAVSPRFGPIGLAIVEAAAADPGTPVEVVTARGAVPGTVDVLSIYDPAKERPRS